MPTEAKNTFFWLSNIELVFQFTRFLISPPNFRSSFCGRVVMEATTSRKINLSWKNIVHQKKHRGQVREAWIEPGVKSLNSFLNPVQWGLIILNSILPIDSLCFTHLGTKTFLFKKTTYISFKDLFSLWISWICSWLFLGLKKNNECSAGNISLLLTFWLTVALCPILLGASILSTDRLQKKKEKNSWCLKGKNTTPWEGEKQCNFLNFRVQRVENSGHQNKAVGKLNNFNDNVHTIGCDLPFEINCFLQFWREIFTGKT